MSTSTAAEKTLKPAFHAAGFGTPHWPVYTPTVLEVVRGLGYVVDERFCVEIADSGRIPVKRDDANHQRWEAVDVAMLIAELECRRRWTADHPAHIHKFNAFERMQIDAERHGASTFITDLDDFDVESLLNLMAESDLRPLRDLLRVAVVTKLNQTGAL